METASPENKETHELSIPELYAILGENTDKLYSNILEKIAEGIRLRIALILSIIKTCRRLNLINDITRANQIVKEGEDLFIENAGIRVHINIDEKLENAREKLANKGMLVLVNHQGGGLETLISRHILARIADKPVHWLPKEELLSIPRFGILLKKTGPIPIKRGEEITREQLESYAQQIAMRLKQNGTVIIAYEGTRSLNGEILMDTKNAKLVALLERVIKKHTEKNSMVKILMTVNTLNCLPRQLEKKPFAKTRLKGSVNVDLSLLDENADLRPTGKENCIFKIAEKKLRKMLLEELGTLRKKHGREKLQY